MKQYLVVIIIIAYLTNGQCSVVRDLAEIWNNKVKSASMTWEGAKRFGNIILYGGEQKPEDIFEWETRSETDVLDDIAVTIHDVTADFAKGAENAYESVKGTTEQVYNDVIGFFKKKFRRKRPEFDFQEYEYKLLRKLPLQNTTQAPNLKKNETVHYVTKSISNADNHNMVDFLLQHVLTAKNSDSKNSTLLNTVNSKTGSRGNSSQMQRNPDSNSKDLRNAALNDTQVFNNLIKQFRRFFGDLGITKKPVRSSDLSKPVHNVEDHTPNVSVSPINIDTNIKKLPRKNKKVYISIMGFEK